LSAAVGLANSYYALGALPEAERALREAMKRAPDSVIVLNNLAQTLSDQGKNEEALPLIERAVERTGSTASPYARAVLETRDTIRRRLAGK
jgi:Tfp pilus assembly protein PilF